MPDYLARLDTNFARKQTKRLTHSIPRGILVSVERETGQDHHKGIKKMRYRQTAVTETQKQLDFLLAGAATFTIKNEKTGNRFTFRSSRSDDNQRYYISVLGGPGNRRNYFFIGTIFNKTTFRHGRKSVIGRGAQSVRVFEWLWKTLNNSKALPEAVTFWNEGMCGRCGRELTVPESIASGYGARCFDIIRQKDPAGWAEWKAEFAATEAAQERKAFNDKMQRDGELDWLLNKNQPKAGQGYSYTGNRYNGTGATNGTRAAAIEC